jgi:FHIPEP family
VPSRRSLSPIPVGVSIDHRFVPRDRDGRPGTERLASAVRRELSKLIGGLGIPGRLQVTVASFDGSEAAPHDALALNVHGQRVRYPPELLSRVWSTLHERVLDRTDPHELDSPRVANGTLVARAVCMTCAQVLGTRPSVLLSDELAFRYAAETPAATLEPAWLREALGAVVDARIAIRDTERVTRLLADLEGTLARDAAEAVIAAQRSRQVVIAIRRAHLRELTSAPADEAFSLADVRTRIAQDLGIALPGFAFVDDPRMAPFGFSFRINDVETLPWIGLPPDRILVDEEPATLEVLGFAGASALHPVTERDNTVVDLGQRDALTAYHVTTWGPMEYLALCLESAVRRFAACLVDEETVRRRLEILQHTGSATTRTSMPPRRVARVMRALLAERVSVSNMPGILEALAEQEEIVSDEARASDTLNAGSVSWRRAEESRLVAGVRERLFRQVAAAVVPDGLEPRIPVLVLDEQLHQAVASHGQSNQPLPAEDVEAVNRAVRAALGEWTGPRWPALLTIGRLRADLRAALYQEFPALAVVAYEELPVDVTIDFVGSIEA